MCAGLRSELRPGARTRFQQIRDAELGGDAHHLRDAIAVDQLLHERSRRHQGAFGNASFRMFSCSAMFSTMYLPASSVLPGVGSRPSSLKRCLTVSLVRARLRLRLSCVTTSLEVPPVA